MAIVKITPVNEKNTCTAGETRTSQFLVSNTSGGPLLCGAQIDSGDNINDWVTIEGRIERNIEEDTDTTISVTIAPPKDLLKESDPPKDYTFRLRVYDATDPEDTVNSPTVSLTVKPAKKEEPKSLLWLWILIGVLVIGIIVGVLIWVLSGDDDSTTISPPVAVEPEPAPVDPKVKQVMNLTSKLKVASLATIKASGKTTIKQTWTADLDTNNAPSNSGADIWFQAKTATDRYVTPRNGASIANMGTKAPGYNGCKNAKLSTGSININKLKANSYLCVKTNKGQYSEVRIAATPGPSPGNLGIQFTTWK